MIFSLPVYKKPDFSVPKLRDAPDAKTLPAPADGVVPEQFHSTTIFPEYFRVNGQWILAEDSRMDSVAVLEKDNTISVKEFRNVKKGDSVFIGRNEKGEEGIFVHNHAFYEDTSGPKDTFIFRTGRSRETAFAKDYDFLCTLLRHEREKGNIVWVLGPACSFDANARKFMSGLIEAGFADAILAGNALATHDLEGALLRTALGTGVYSQRPMPGGHYNHLDVINKVRTCGSIPSFIKTNNIQDGIIHSCVKNDVPFVLSSSIRDDGPLPEVIPSSYESQDQMRAYVRKATTMICIATQLHSIAAGNMMSGFRVVGGVPRPTFMYCIDMSEFVVNKLHDRGSLSSVSIVANAQDFLYRLYDGLIRNEKITK